MIIDTSKTIAYKCSLCGSFEFFSLSVFKLLNQKEVNFACHCKKTRVSISEMNSSDYKISMDCIGCGNEHIFIISRKDLLSKDLSVFNCPETGVEICFIGFDEIVRHRIDLLEKELDDMMDKFGYESYFKNTRVMFDSLNKIHDVAEKGNLYCECDKKDIELILLPDKIQLKCLQCKASIIISAASNEDLKYIHKIQFINLSGQIGGYGRMRIKPFKTQTDGK